VTTARSRPRVALAHLAYLALTHLACALALAPWIVRAVRDPRQWSWIGARLGRLRGTPPGGRPLWLHAVSVGEVKASRELLARLQARGLPVVLSTGTVTGLETARRSFPGVYVFPWPLDLPWVVRRVMARIQPRSIVMVELEVWPTLMRLADRAGIPQAIVNGRVSQSSYSSYRRLRWWLPEFDRLHLVAAQNEVYAGRIVDLGVPADRVVVCGNLKHDLTEAAPPAACAALGKELALAGDRPVIVAGSTHDGEDEPAVRAWLAAGGAEAAELVLVPRHLDRVPEIGRLLRRLEVPCALRSGLPGPRPAGSIVLVDTMGELEALFGLADVVFLGGSLVPVGGHNVLEPAAAGVGVLVGPHLDSCRVEADALQAAGGLEVVADGVALASSLRRLVDDQSARAAMGSAARAACEGLSGATDATLLELERAGMLDVSSLDRAGGSGTLGGSIRAENTATGVHHQ
jgi:3-deoxy-D-manno-octulosonic-acid transferase